MKVKFTKQAKTYITVAEAAEARKIIESLKNDDESATDYLRSAGNLANKMINNSPFGIDRVLEADAEISRNNRAWDNYHEGSGKLDVWVQGLVKADLDTYMEIGAYLSDIWNITGNNEMDADIIEHMYIEVYRRDKKC